MQKNQRLDPYFAQQDFLTEYYRDTPTDRELLLQVIDRLARLERRLDLIYGDNYVINGKLVEIDLGKKGK